MTAEPRNRRGPVLLIVAGALAWIGLLAALVLTSANPVVVNRTQVLSAQAIVQGEWRPGSPGRLTIERAWKAPLEGEVRVRAPEGLNSTGRLIMPLTRIGPDLFEITQGALPTIPEHTARDRLPEPAQMAQVRPLVYPATPDVVQQIEALLNEPVRH